MSYWYDRSDERYCLPEYMRSPVCVQLLSVSSESRGLCLPWRRFSVQWTMRFDLSVRRRQRSGSFSMYDFASMIKLSSLNRHEFLAKNSSKKQLKVSHVERKFRTHFKIQCDNASVKSVNVRVHSVRFCKGLHRSCLGQFTRVKTNE